MIPPNISPGVASCPRMSLIVQTAAPGSAGMMEFGVSLDLWTDPVDALSVSFEGLDLEAHPLA